MLCSTTAFSMEPKELMCSDSSPTPDIWRAPTQKTHGNTSICRRARAHWLEHNTTMLSLYRHDSMPFAVFIAFVVMLLCKRWCALTCPSSGPNTSVTVHHAQQWMGHHATMMPNRTDGHKNKQTEAHAQAQAKKVHVMSGLINRNPWLLSVSHL